MCWLDFFKTESFIALSSFFVAGASFWVSWLSYKRDSGRLDFYVGVGEIWGGQPFQKQRDVIQFRIVNSGRRPLIVNSIGGDNRGEKLIRFLARYAPNRFKPTAYIFDSPIVTSALTPNGQPRVLHEGESISFHLPLPDSHPLLEKMATGSDSIYVFDTIGRKHRVPGPVLKKLRKDFLNRGNTEGAE